MRRTRESQGGGGRAAAPAAAAAAGLRIRRRPRAPLRPLLSPPPAAILLLLLLLVPAPRLGQCCLAESGQGGGGGGREGGEGGSPASGGETQQQQQQQRPSAPLRPPPAPRAWGVRLPPGPPGEGRGLGEKGGRREEEGEDRPARSFEGTVREGAAEEGATEGDGEPDDGGDGSADSAGGSLQRDQTDGEDGGGEEESLLSMRDLLPPEEEEDEPDHGEPIIEEAPAPVLLVDLTVEALSEADHYLRLFGGEEEEEEGAHELGEEGERDGPPREGGGGDGKRRGRAPAPPDRSLVLALVVAADDGGEGGEGSCPHGPAALGRFREAARRVQGLPGLRLGVLRLDPRADAGKLEMLGLDRLPALLFATWSREIDSTVVIEYAGLRSTPAEVAETARHYWRRLVAASDGLELSPSGEMAHARPPAYPGLEEMREALAAHGLLDDPAEGDAPLPPLPPDMPAGEARYARWLLAEEQDGEEDSGGSDGLSLPDGAKVFVQCRPEQGDSSSPPGSSSLDARLLFDQASRALSGRRDCFFAALRDCRGVSAGGPGGAAIRDDGSVWGYAVPHGFDHRISDFAAEVEPVHLGGGGGGGADRDDGTRALMHAVAQFARPSVLWFDRQTTAPVVFGLRQRLHAVLVVDARPPASPSNATGDPSRRPGGSDEPDWVPDDRHARTRAALVHFRRQCRGHRRLVACLVVPSTETRVLAALGVDPWSPLDARADASPRPSGGSGSSVDEHEEEPVLPAAILTDREREPGKTLVYRLDAGRLLSDPEGSLAFFFAHFVAGDRRAARALRPTVRSDPRGPRTNAAGVRILTGASVGELDGAGAGGDGPPPHALLLLVAPTCGHCKRAAVAWNRLSEFLGDVKWDFVRLYLLDVSENEVPDGVVPRWLPDAYYYGRDRGGGGGGGGMNASFVRFDWIDDEDEAGPRQLQDHEADWDVSVLLDWFLAVANLTDAELSRLLDGLDDN